MNMKINKLLIGLLLVGSIFTAYGQTSKQARIDKLKADIAKYTRLIESETRKISLFNSRLQIYITKEAILHKVQDEFNFWDKKCNMMPILLARTVCRLAEVEPRRQRIVILQAEITAKKALYSLQKSNAENILARYQDLLDKAKEELDDLVSPGLKKK